MNKRSKAPETQLREQQGVSHRLSHSLAQTRTALSHRGIAQRYRTVAQGTYKVPVLCEPVRGPLLCGKFPPTDETHPTVRCDFKTSCRYSGTEWPRRLTGTDATQTRFGPLVRRDGDANMRAAARYPARWSVLSCSRRAFSMGLRRGLLHCGETRRQQPTCRPFFASPLHRPARRAKLQPPRFIRAAIRFAKPKLGGWLPANVGRHLFHGQPG